MNWGLFDGRAEVQIEDDHFKRFSLGEWDVAAVYVYMIMIGISFFKLGE